MSAVHYGISIVLSIMIGIGGTNVFRALRDKGAPYRALPHTCAIEEQQHFFKGGFEAGHDMGFTRAQRQCQVLFKEHCRP